jgi:hypothetical protein
MKELEIQVEKQEREMRLREQESKNRISMIAGMLYIPLEKAQSLQRSFNDRLISSENTLVFIDEKLQVDKYYAALKVYMVNNNVKIRSLDVHDLQSY